MNKKQFDEWEKAQLTFTLNIGKTVEINEKLKVK